MDAKAVFKQAREAYEAGDTETAIKFYEQIMNAYPGTEEYDLSQSHLYNIRKEHGDSGVGVESQPALVATNSTSVVVTDIQMPFWSMVVFMVKWSVASIPAAIILLIIVTLFLGVFANLLK
jgi:hypothetical protein